MRAIPAAVQAALQNKDLNPAPPSWEVKASTGSASAVTIPSDTTTRCYKLGIEPSDWQDADFDDSAWASAVVQTYSAPWQDISACDFIWESAGGTHPAPETVLFRRKFTLSGLGITSATIEINHDNALEGLWVNGTFVASYDAADNLNGTRTYDVAAYLLDNGRDNVIACRVLQRDNPSPAMVQFKLTVNLAGEKSLTYIKSIRVERRDGQFAATATLVLDNQDGRYAPDKTGSEWENVLFPGIGTKITIKQGYGSDLVETFTGYIDELEMGRDPNLAEMVLHLRDRFKLLQDQKLEIDGSLTGELTDTSPEAAFTTVCEACGFATGEITAVSTGMTGWGFKYDRDKGDTFIARLTGNLALRALADETGNAVLDDYAEELAADVVYEEGGDASRIGRLTRVPGYTISDKAIYKELRFYGLDADSNTLTSTYTFTSSKITLPPKKYLEYAVEGGPVSQGQLDSIATREGRKTAAQLRRGPWRGPAIPWHQLLDVVQFVESTTTASELYTIVGMVLEQDNTGRFEQELETIHFGAT